METTSIFGDELLNSDVYLKTINQLTRQPVNQFKQAHRLLISLLIACLHRQLQTDIGRNLVHKVLVKQASLTEPVTAFWLSPDTNLSTCATEGNRLFSTVIPGRKSALVRIAMHYARLSYSETDLVIGLCAYALFTSLSTRLTSHSDLRELLPALDELTIFTPELTRKDYEALGIYTGMKHNIYQF